MPRPSFPNTPAGNLVPPCAPRGPAQAPDTLVPGTGPAQGSADLVRTPVSGTRVAARFRASLLLPPPLLLLLLLLVPALVKVLVLVPVPVLCLWTLSIWTLLSVWTPCLWDLRPCARPCAHLVRDMQKEWKDLDPVCLDPVHLDPPVCLNPCLLDLRPCARPCAYLVRDKQKEWKDLDPVCLDPVHLDPVHLSVLDLVRNPVLSTRSPDLVRDPASGTGSNALVRNPAGGTRSGTRRANIYLYTFPSTLSAWASSLKPVHEITLEARIEVAKPIKTYIKLI